MECPSSWFHPYLIYLPWKSRHNIFLLETSQIIFALFQVFISSRRFSVFTVPLDTWVLRLDNVTSADQGLYDCHLNNNNTPIKMSILLIVRGKILIIYEDLSNAISNNIYCVFTPAISSSKVYGTWWFRAYFEQSVLWSWLKFRDMLSGTNIWTRTKKHQK